MPNNFGGNQQDLEYAPHLYEKKSEFETCDPSAPAVPSSSDRRIRSIVGDYRAVIPNGAQKGRRFFTNSSPVVIEKRGKDATGAEKWDRVTLLPKPAPQGADGDADYAINHALYWLLAGPDAE